jgi:hypothetical protein
VSDEKMLEKLTTHDIQDVTELFSLADKCARATEGRAWHTAPALGSGKDSKPNVETAAQGGGNNNKKAGGNNQLLAGAPTAAIVVVGGAEAHEETSTTVRLPVATMEAPDARCITPRATA